MLIPFQQSAARIARDRASQASQRPAASRERPGLWASSARIGQTTRQIPSAVDASARWQTTERHCRSGSVTSRRVGPRGPMDALAARRGPPMSRRNAASALFGCSGGLRVPCPVRYKALEGWDKRGPRVSCRVLSSMPVLGWRGLWLSHVSVSCSEPARSATCRLGRQPSQPALRRPAIATHPHAEVLTRCISLRTARRGS